MRIDDPINVFSVHGMSGLLSILYAIIPHSKTHENVLYGNLIGILAIIAFSVITTLLMVWLLSKQLRVSRAEETVGLDFY